MAGYGLSLGGSSDCSKRGCKAGALALALAVALGAAGAEAVAERGATGLEGMG